MKQPTVLAVLIVLALAGLACTMAAGVVETPTAGPTALPDAPTATLPPNPSPQATGVGGPNPTLGATSSNPAHPTTQAGQSGVSTAPATPTVTTAPTGLTYGAPQGYITFEYLYGDAGNFSMLAGSQNFMVWEDFPRGAGRYEFVIENYQGSGEAEVIGVDTTPESGVTTDWLVPERVSGTLIGYAYFADGSVIPSQVAGEVYSGEAPPEGVCSVQSGNIGAVPIFGTPNENTEQIAEMWPGAYAQVLGRYGDSWLLIDMASAFEGRSEVPPWPTGWVWAGSAITYHGPCDTLPEATP